MCILTMENLNQLDLFKDTAYDDEPRTLDQIIEQLSREYPVTIPDDLTVIRMLAEEKKFEAYDDLEYLTSKYIDHQLQGRFDMYEHHPKTYDAYVEYITDKVFGVISSVHEILVESLEICASEIHSTFLDNLDTQADYIAYIYNINAPFHGRKPIHYKDLQKALMPTNNSL